MTFRSAARPVARGIAIGRAVLMASSRVGRCRALLINLEPG
jgi:hypothetical protein